MTAHDPEFKIVRGHRPRLQLSHNDRSGPDFVPRSHLLTGEDLTVKDAPDNVSV